MNCKTSNPAASAAFLKASFCASEKFVGTVITAALTSLPRKSEAEVFSLLICRVEISETVTVFSSSDWVSRIEKAIVESCSRGWADWWQGVGSIDS